MELQITGTNMEIKPTIRRYAERKLGKLNRHLPHIIEARVDIAEEKTKSPQQHYLVRVTVDSSGAVFHSEERGEDLFQAIDKTAATMTRQLEHYKGKLYDKGREISLTRGELGEEAAREETSGRLVKVKRFPVKPMTITEAVDQMQLLGHDFFLFFDADVEEIKLLYQRNDGNYGLIEPEIG